MIPRFWNNIRYFVVKGELVKIIKPTYIENAMPKGI